LNDTNISDIGSPAHQFSKELRRRSAHVDATLVDSFNLINMNTITDDELSRASGIPKLRGNSSISIELIYFLRYQTKFLNRCCFF